MYEGGKNKTGREQVEKKVKRREKRAYVYKGQENKTGREQMCTKGRET